LVLSATVVIASSAPAGAADPPWMKQPESERIFFRMAVRGDIYSQFLPSCPPGFARPAADETSVFYYRESRTVEFVSTQP